LTVVPAEDVSSATAEGATSATWATVRDRLRDRGLRWTPQRRTLVEVLSQTRGHVTGSELIDRCRELDPATTPSTVYRTLDVLEELGLVSHSHGVNGREEFHVLPREEHGHLHCIACGGSWEIEGDEASALVAAVRARRGFAVDLSHLSVAGRCVDCGGADPASDPARGRASGPAMRAAPRRLMG
jgi:Fur family ferric uptake transcriptional regulator